MHINTDLIKGNINNINVNNISSKNLLNYKSFTNGRIDNGVVGYQLDSAVLVGNTNSVTITTYVQWRGAVSSFIKVKPNTSYVYSMQRPNNSIGGNCHCYDVNWNYLGAATEGTTSVPETSTFFNKKYTTLANTRYVKLVISSSSAANAVVVSNLQFEEGTVPTDVCEYVGLEDCDSGWINLPMANGFIAYDGQTKPAYRIINNIIYLRGTIKVGSDYSGVRTFTVVPRPDSSQTNVLYIPFIYIRSGVKYADQIQYTTSGGIYAPSAIAVGDWFSVDNVQLVFRQP